MAVYSVEQALGKSQHYLVFEQVRSITGVYIHKSLIVFLIDLTSLNQAKLNAGVRLSHYMTSYGDRPNDYESISKCTV